MGSCPRAELEAGSGCTSKLARRGWQLRRLRPRLARLTAPAVPPHACTDRRTGKSAQSPQRGMNRRRRFPCLKRVSTRMEVVHPCRRTSIPATTSSVSVAKDDPSPGAVDPPKGRIPNLGIAPLPLAHPGSPPLELDPSQRIWLRELGGILWTVPLVRWQHALAWVRCPPLRRYRGQPGPQVAGGSARRLQRGRLGRRALESGASSRHDVRILA